MPEEQAPATRLYPGRDVFISYASPDKAVADAVCAALEAAGVTCWIAPRDVTPGEFYAESIVHALDSSKVIALVLSQHAADSNHVIREVERASSKRHPVVSFRIDASPLPAGLEYFLNTSQWLDATATGVDRAIPRLVDAVRSALALPSSTARAQAGPNASLTRRLTRWRAALAAVIVAALGYVVVDKVWIAKRVDDRRSLAAASVSVVKPAAVPIIPDMSVAVLPFVDMSEKKDQEYFSEGLSEELIDLLSKVSALRVPARTSSFYFKNRSEDIPTIARRLLVAHVLEGSVRKAGDHVRITVQLVRADNGYHLWSQTYDRKLDDIFKVQDEIASAVVSALKVSLLGSDAPRSSPASNSEAYTLYLQARSIYWSGSTHADSERAFSLLRKALTLDPTFARGWATLAVFLCGDASYFDLALEAPERKEAHDAAKRALELDPALAEGHAAMGRFLFQVQWDWKAAEAEFRKALELDPRDEISLLDLPDLISILYTNSPEELLFAKRAIDRDPTNSIVYFDLANVYFRAHKFSEAEQAARMAIQVSPREEGLASLLASILMYKGDPAAALVELEREPGERWRETPRPQILYALGRTQEADAALAAVQKKYANTAPYAIAAVYAQKGDLDHAFEWLERAYQQREFLLGFVGVDLDFSKLKPDPRFRALLRKLNLPD